MQAGQPTIEFWFEFGSTYSYLSVMRIEALAAVREVTLHYKPFLLGPIFKTLGFKNSPFNEQKAKGEYMWRDLERQCQLHGLAWKKPSEFPRLTVLPMRVALLGAEQPWMGAFCREVMLAAFARDEDISGEPAVRAILERLDLPADELLAEAQSEANKLRLREQTERASQLGIFGAPMFFAGGEMFWGNDRLEQALDWAKRS
ncbi:MAG: 2-hydroxychromene-2-carboxylate isomerase [Myxococcales bacterium]